MASNTTNLNLYKKDPIADKDQTFNITTMMNENWDKIDQNAGQTATQLAQIELELDNKCDKVVPTETIITTGFAAGWSGEIRVSKTQEGLNIYKIISLEKTTDITNAGAENVRVLDVGTRPFHTIRFTAFGYTSANAKVNNSQLDIIIATNGSIFIGNSGGATTNVRKILDLQLVGL